MFCMIGFLLNMAISMKDVPAPATRFSSEWVPGYVISNIAIISLNHLISSSPFLKTKLYPRYLYNFGGRYQKKLYRYAYPYAIFPISIFVWLNGIEFSSFLKVKLPLFQPNANIEIPFRTSEEVCIWTGEFGTWYANLGVLCMTLYPYMCLQILIGINLNRAIISSLIWYLLSTHRQAILLLFSL